MTTEALAALLARPGLSDAAKVVYLALVGFCPAGEGSPTNRQLSEATGGRSDDAIRSALRRLEEAGLVAFRLTPGLPRVAVLAEPPANPLGDSPEIYGESPRESTGDTPRESTGGTPRENTTPRESAGSTPRESAGSTPRENAGGLPVKMRGDSPRISGESPQICGGTPRENAGGSRALSKRIKENSLINSIPNSGEGIGGGMEDPRESPGVAPTLQATGFLDPPEAAPDDFLALCHKVARLLGRKAPGFADLFRAAWADDLRVRYWWVDPEIPRGCWSEALDILARPATGAAKCNLAYYVRVVRNLAAEARRPPAPAAAPPERPEPTPAYLRPAPPRPNSPFARFARSADVH
jgi:hypothetical protein